MKPQSTPPPLQKKRPTIVVMARWPAPGRCKTRLAGEVGSESAARIQTQLTKHTIAVAKILAKEKLAEIQLAISGPSSKEAKRWSRKEGLENIYCQGEGALGLRMRKQVLFAQKRQPQEKAGRTTILIGSDLPTLCKLDLIHAIEKLKTHELVLGPSSDGGYWLIGLTGRLVKPVVKWPFYGIRWGSDQVLEQTIQRAKSEGINHGLLREQNDIDKIEDLSPWQG